ncbi:NAD-dependent dehydratase [Humibacillus sp. DSM 29435]|uniref:SDR family oxidoreductase n=1 Tax=Humibacillus sp. DSM 29435 TaxID=1869167 RepID=UPI0008726E2B|nr:SDR family oxidoreductase [Humibacillus sp. DSM 29435]OFE17148.1 NAD-dependent dehydratase [Humibacillus sp. DSM 29435]
MARIVIIGGHGKVALLAVPLLVEAGHEVTAVIRKPEQSEDLVAVGAQPLVLDIETGSVEELNDALRGHDVVVWSAGAGGGSPERTYAVDRDAAIRSVDAALAAEVTRYVMVSYFGAGPDHGVPEDNGFFAYAEAKSAADAYLAASGLDHVILRPSGLTDGAASGTIEWGEGIEAATVSRGNVAQVIAVVVDAAPTASESSAPTGRVIEFNDGDRPVSELAAG